MNPKHLSLAGEFLIEASKQLYCAGNDWRWPADWFAAECRDFAALMVSDNVGRSIAGFTAEDHCSVEDLCRGVFSPPDWWVALVLGKMLKTAAAAEKEP